MYLTPYNSFFFWECTSKDELSHAAVTNSQWFITAIFYFLFTFVTAARWLSLFSASSLLDRGEKGSSHLGRGWSQGGDKRKMAEPCDGRKAFTGSVTQHSTSLCHFKSWQPGLMSVGGRWAILPQGALSHSGSVWSTLKSPHWGHRTWTSLWAWVIFPLDIVPIFPLAEKRIKTMRQCRIRPHTNLGFHPKFVILVLYAFLLIGEKQ